MMALSVPKPPLKPINEVIDLLIHLDLILFTITKNELNMANSADHDETRFLRRLIWVYAICKCPLFGIIYICISHIPTIAYVEF